MPQRLHRVGNPWVSQRLAARTRHRRRDHGRLPSRVVEAHLVPASRGMNRRLPLRSAGKDSRGSIRVLDKQRGVHRRRIFRGHSAGIDHVVNNLDGNCVHAGSQMRGYIRAHVLLPRHLLRGQKRLRFQHLRSVDPGGNRIPPRSEKRGPAHRLGQRYCRPVGKVQLGRLLRGQSFRVGVGDPLGRRVAHRGLLRRLVAYPLGPPGVLFIEARLPPSDRALRVRLARRVPCLHPPEIARDGLERWPLVADIQRLARRDPPAIPNVRVACAQTGRT